MKPAWHIITYDIRNPGRLQKLHKFLRARAFSLQKSVFAWQGTPAQLIALQQQIGQLIRPSEDDVRGYRIPARQSIHIWGVHPFCNGIFDARYPPVKHRADNFEIQTTPHLHPVQACLTDDDITNSGLDE